MSTRLKTSQKIVLWLISEGKTRIWLAKELGITRQTLAQRMKDNYFTIGELMTLRRLGFID